MERVWWKEAIVYQVYPRSFKDSNGDGIGDLPGIIEKLDYIKSLGVTAVWLNPIYQSPNEDGGYDISDYYSILKEFGTLEDFDRLIQGMHERGLKLIMDLVVNHTSDEHPWFQASRKSTDSSLRDFYFWRPGKDGAPPNNWPSFFGGSAWQLDQATGEYYLHLFSVKQPDLNWENPALRKEVQDMMKFWLDKGVDGLRLDVISAISKRTSFPDADTPNFNETIRKYYANGPRLKEFIREMREKVWNHYDVMTIGEGPGITPENALDYLDERIGLNMIFHFGHMFMDQGPGGRFDPIPWSKSDFRAVFMTWDNAFSKSGWGSIFLGNHDFARMVSRWGNDSTFHQQSSKLLCTLLMTMRGTPFIFQGDEIGMTNFQLKTIGESRDIETINGWREAEKKGMPEAAFLRVANYSGRDNARTPMQWDNSSNAGFSSGIPWMPINPNNAAINVNRQEQEPDSVLSYWKKMIGIRKAHPVLTYGAYKPVEIDNEHLFVYYRESDEEKILVILNMSDVDTKFPSAVRDARGQVLIGNYAKEIKDRLNPWEAIVIQL